jgi:hypothetical protein
MPSALFEPDDDLYVPTELTRGGWSDNAQHGSPPCGLLGRALESLPTAVPMQVVRFTVDLFREVPLRPLRVETDVIRDGKRIQVAEARLWAGDVQVGRATSLKIRTDEIDDDEIVGTAGPQVPPRPDPESLTELHWRDHFGLDESLLRFHTDAVEIRSVDDSFLKATPGESWFRLKAALVAGEEMTPFQRAAVATDLANGNAQALDPKRWLYVNPDNTLYLHQLPDGEWIGMRSVAHQFRTGIGVTETQLYDRQRRIGHISQAQLIDRR